MADEVLRLGSCDLKLRPYFRSVLPLLSEPKFNTDKHIKVLSNVRPSQDGEEYKNAFGGVPYFTLCTGHYDKKFYSHFLKVYLKVQKYDPVIKSIVKAVFGDE